MSFSKKVLVVIMLVSTFFSCVDLDDTSSLDDTSNILQSTITHVQPMTGIVLWNDSDYASSDSIQIEYSYMRFDEIAISEDITLWDWSSVETILDSISAHEHQAILRFYYTYPGQGTTVPDYIKNMSDYNESTSLSEELVTTFPDWSHISLKTFTKTFYTEFAKRYDTDPRLVFLQVGFGLWGEYHIYDPGEQLGINFPDKTYQEEFLNHLDSIFTTLHWSISIDAADSEISPLTTLSNLNDLEFGLFDDSFLNSDHSDYNKSCFDFFGINRRNESPIGGEFSYYSDYDQEHVLDLPNGPHGVSYEEMIQEYNVSYMIGNDQPDYQTMDRIEEAGIASGYNFEITAFIVSDTNSSVTVSNTGVAPIYYDAYVTVNGVRSSDSLKGLLSGTSKVFEVLSGGINPVVTIECDRLVTGQEIQYDADL